MITKDAREFFVNGHHCEIVYERREHYTGWIGGEQITSGHNPSRIRETLIEDGKYRESVEPAFWRVARAVYNFVEQQRDYDDNYLWVYNDVVIDAVTPTNSLGPAYMALLVLEEEGLLEQGEICMDLNVEDMWRATGTELDDAKDLSR